ncbi:hypothetical protein ACFC0C_03775 [Streptomyces sp. NPDC056178]|uniref:hypothetical protein n=1 Tax=unclassified Streptomyces TaxID=2593676 RepID=UPI0035E3B266
MPLPYARSVPEAHLYMELHPCECGESGSTGYRHASIQTDQGLASEHSFGCAGCGRQRRFVFRMPALVPQHTDRYGGPEPSQIIDAGEWRMISLAYMGELDRVRARSDELRKMLDEALAAYQELLKFIPAGQERMPDSAFFTERGRRIREGEPPNSFSRHFLEAMVDGVRRDLAAVR